MRVYCPDCKYDKDIGGEYCASNKCFYPDNLSKGYNHVRCYTEFLSGESTINKNNDCSWFEPKWYKKRKYR